MIGAVRLVAGGNNENHCFGCACDHPNLIGSERCKLEPFWKPGFNMHRRLRPLDSSRPDSIRPGWFVLAGGLSQAPPRRTYEATAAHLNATAAHYPKAPTPGVLTGSWSSL